MSNGQQKTGKLDTSYAKKGGPLTPEQRVRKQQSFLKTYRKTANIKASCETAKVSRQTFYDWKENDESFRAQLADAEEDANDTLEYAAYDRAVLGVESYVVSQGRIVYEEIPELDEHGNPVFDEKGNPKTKRGKPLVERKYSDTLLVTRLKARMPEKYKEKQQVDANLTHSGSIDSKTIAFDPKSLTDDELKAMKDMLLKAYQREREQ